MMKVIFLISLLGVAVATGAASYVGNTDSGFGGAVGNGSLDLTDDGTTLNVTFNRGVSGDFNDALVVYIDSVAGGDNSTVGYTDEGDGLRRAISGLDGGNSSDLTFAAGFGADYVIAMNNGFAGLWQLSTGGTHAFITDLGLSPSGTNNAASYGLSLSVTDIGLSAAAGESFDFLSSYLSESAFRSTESIGNDVSGTQGFNPFTSGSAQSYTTIPEPSAAMLGILGGVFFLRRRR